MLRQVHYLATHASATHSVLVRRSADGTFGIAFDDACVVQQVAHHVRHLRVGDRIVAANGFPVSAGAELARITRSAVSAVLSFVRTDSPKQPSSQSPLVPAHFHDDTGATTKRE